MDNENKNVAIVIPISTKPVASSIIAGNIQYGQPVGLNVRVETGACRSDEEEHIYYVDTIVYCDSDEMDLHISVAVQSKIFALGKEQSVYENLKYSVRDVAFLEAEKMVFKISSLYGIPVKLELLKHLQEYEDNQG